MLDLFENCINATGAAAIGSLISNVDYNKSNTGIMVLDPSIDLWEKNGCFVRLNNAQFDDEGMSAFIKALQSSGNRNNITCLSFKNNSISSTGVVCLAEGVQSIAINFCHGFQSLSVLDLSDNKLELKGAEAIAEILSCNQNLMILILCRCQLMVTEDDKIGEIVKRMFQKFCPSSKRNTNLNILALNGNCFHGEGIHILATYMYLCRRVEHLICNNCNLTSDDLKCLFKQLSKLQSSLPRFRGRIQKWVLWNNKIDDWGVMALIDHLKSLFPCLCHNFKDADLSNNPISIQMMKNLSDEMKRLDNGDVKSPFSSILSDLEEEKDLALLRSPSSSVCTPTSSFTESTDQFMISSERESCDEDQEQDVQSFHLPKSSPSSSPVEPPAKRARLSVQDTESSETTEHEESKSATKDQICTKSTGSQIPKPHPIKSESHYGRVQPDHIKVSQDKLTVNDLASVLRTVWDGRAKWYNIGLELGLTAPKLDAIKKSCHHDTEECFTATLKEWLSSGDLRRSWSHLANSLRTPPVGLGDLAEQLSPVTMHPKL